MTPRGYAGRQAGTELFDFADHRARFRWWLIIGGAGVGKSGSKVVKTKELAESAPPKAVRTVRDPFGYIAIVAADIGSR